MTIKQHGGVFGRNPSFNDVSVETLSIAGTALSSTAAELNILDGVTSTTAELNILDGVTATTAELNILDGVTSDATELNYLDGASTSVVTASKAVLANASANIPFASGNGIDFSATAGTGTSELFDDYEEGTWTPVVSSAGGTVTGANQGSNYAKVGSLVAAYGYINVSSVGSPSGALTISGLPFASSAQYFPVTITLFGGGFTTSENGYGGAGNTSFGTTNINANVMTGGENIMFTAIYRV